MFLHGLGGMWQNWLLNIPYFMERFRVDRARTCRASAAPRCPPGGSRSRASRGSSTRCATGWGSTTLSSSATRWAASSAPSSRWPSRPACASSCWSRPRASRPRASGASRCWPSGALMAVGAGARASRRCRSSTARGCGEPRCSSSCATRSGSRCRWRPNSCAAAGHQGLRRRAGRRARLLVPRAPARHRDPVLIVWGRNDTLIPVEDAYEFERLIGANARVEIFEDTGHLAMVERPTRFNALLDAFIAGSTGARGGHRGRPP